MGCADLNGDGNTDFVYLRCNAGGRCLPTAHDIFLGNGNGTFKPAYTMMAAGIEAPARHLGWTSDAIAFVDYNKDGKPTSCWGRTSASSARARRRSIAGGRAAQRRRHAAPQFDSAGEPASPTWLRPARRRSTVAVADFNGDGVPDYRRRRPLHPEPAACTPASSAAAWARSRTCLPGYGGGATTILAADFSRDGQARPPGRQRRPRRLSRRRGLLLREQRHRDAVRRRHQADHHHRPRPISTWAGRSTTTTTPMAPSTSSSPTATTPRRTTCSPTAPSDEYVTCGTVASPTGGPRRARHHRDDRHHVRIDADPLPPRPPTAPSPGRRRTTTANSWHPPLACADDATKFCVEPHHHQRLARSAGGRPCARSPATPPTPPHPVAGPDRHLDQLHLRHRPEPFPRRPDRPRRPHLRGRVPHARQLPATCSPSTTQTGATLLGRRRPCWTPPARPIGTSSPSTTTGSERAGDCRLDFNTSCASDPSCRRRCSRPTRPSPPTSSNWFLSPRFGLLPPLHAWARSRTRRRRCCRRRARPTGTSSPGPPSPRRPPSTPTSRAYADRAPARFRRRQGRRDARLLHQPRRPSRSHQRQRGVGVHPPRRRPANARRQDHRRQ